MAITPLPPVPGRIVLDVSHWNSVIDWGAVKASGVTKAICKITEGQNFGDPLGPYNFRAGREAGVEIGFYHYLRPNIDAARQIEVFRRALYGAYWAPEGSLLALDIEATGGLTVSRLRTHILSSYRAVLRDLQVIPDFYTRMSFWRQFVGAVNWEVEGLPVPALWAADYGWDRKGGGMLGPRWITHTWKTWKRWQYSDLGRVPGVPGSADMNVER